MANIKRALICCLYLWLAAVAIAPAGHAAEANAAAKRPHVIFILADDLGFGDVGCYDCPDIRTPHIDRLAREGTRFTDFYANAPSCTPTRAAFLTARYQQRIGLEDALYYQEMERGLPVDGKTVAHVLQESGYATALAGKWHLGYDRRRQPNAQGFDRFFGLLGGNHHYFEHVDRIGVPDLFLDKEPVEMDGYSTDLITDHAVRFFRESAPSQPTFLYLAYGAPHFPWQGPGDADREVKPRHKSWQEGDRETYIAMVENMDAGIGRVLQEIDDLGIREETLVVFTSDNGGHTWSRNAPLKEGKATVWEGGIRVPCVARWPGRIPAGKDLRQPAITMDWSATILRLAGVEKLEGGEDGIDLMPLITGRREPLERTFFWRRVPGPVRKKVDIHRAVRRGNWKFIDRPDGEQFLYDLETDVAEAHNLAPSRAGLCAELAKAIDVWEERVCGEPGAGKP